MIPKDLILTKEKPLTAKDLIEWLKAVPDSAIIDIQTYTVFMDPEILYNPETNTVDIISGI
jgi:hypothetical protein